jgi:hypothetical protein
MERAVKECSYASPLFLQHTDSPGASFSPRGYRHTSSVDQTSYSASTQMSDSDHKSPWALAIVFFSLIFTGTMLWLIYSKL